MIISLLQIPTRTWLCLVNALFSESDGPLRIEYGKWMEQGKRCKRGKGDISPGSAWERAGSGKTRAG
jgi:hypothetical protein